MVEFELVDTRNGERDSLRLRLSDKKSRSFVWLVLNFPILEGTHVHLLQESDRLTTFEKFTHGQKNSPYIHIKPSSRQSCP